MQCRKCGEDVMPARLGENMIRLSLGSKGYYRVSHSGEAATVRRGQGKWVLHSDVCQPLYQEPPPPPRDNGYRLKARRKSMK